MTRTMTGGCQCGRVRYRFDAEGAQAYLCHCRMCQRATGGFAAALVSIPAGVVWESEPAWYASSAIARRPFCSTCGTPLGFAYNDGANESAVDVTFGSLDHPQLLTPLAHFGVESIHEAWIDTSTLPRQRSEDTESVAGRWSKAGLEVPE